MILAGGASSRFGSDKAFAQVDDTPLIAHVAHALRLCDGVVVIGRENDSALSELGLEHTPDLPGSKGPAVGLMSALNYGREHDYSHIFVTSCDMWGLLPEWPHLLAKSAEPVAAVHDGRWQPMCSVWRTDTALPDIPDGARSPSLKSFLDALNAAKVSPPEGWQQVQSINAPEDLEGVQKKLAESRCERSKTH